MKADGRLGHHFHGAYWALVVLAFDDDASASAARQVLGENDWKPSEKNAAVLRWNGNSEELERVKAKLGGFSLTICPCGFRHCTDSCSGQPIDSIRHSVDVGPQFTVDIPPPVPKEQLALPAEPARLDPDGTAEPKTRLLGHRVVGHCVGPGSVPGDTLEDTATGERTKLV